jgi:hypothetical protein
LLIKALSVFTRRKGRKTEHVRRPEHRLRRRDRQRVTDAKLQHDPLFLLVLS